MVQLVKESLLVYQSFIAGLSAPIIREYPVRLDVHCFLWPVYQASPTRVDEMKICLYVCLYVYMFICLCLYVYVYGTFVFRI